MAKEKLGFIGLGRMGKPMAENLLKAGYQVTVYNRSQGAVDELVAKGAQRAASPAEVGRAAGIVILCLPKPNDVEQIVTGPNGVLEGLHKGDVIVDCSTIDPLTSRKMAEVSTKKDVTFLDAPISGGPPGAQAGTLTIMVGGDQDTFERIKPILEAMGKNIFYTGPSGNGSVTKMINQLLVGTTTAALAEAFVLGTKAGMNPQLLYDVLSTGFADSRMLRRHVPDFYLKRNWEPGFSIDMLLKDMTLAAGLGDQNNVSTPVLDRAIERFKEAQSAGLGNNDMSGVIKLGEKESDVEVK